MVSLMMIRIPLAAANPRPWRDPARARGWWSLLLAVLWRPTPSAFVACGIALVARALAIVAVHHAIGTPGRHAPLLSLLSELLQPLHLLHAAVWRRITWRTRHYRVVDAGEFEAVE